MRFLSYVLSCSDIIVFNILKYHLNCKLFQKTKLFIMEHIFFEKKSENFAKFGQGNPGKIGKVWSVVEVDVFFEGAIKLLI